MLRTTDVCECVPQVYRCCGSPEGDARSPEDGVTGGGELVGARNGTWVLEKIYKFSEPLKPVVLNLWVIDLTFHRGDISEIPHIRHLHYDS